MKHKPTRIQALFIVLITIPFTVVKGGSEESMVYVSGTVQSPGEHKVNIRGAAHALAAAGGILPTGCPHRAVVHLKQKSGEWRMFGVNIQEIVIENNADILLPENSVLSFAHDSLGCKVAKFNAALAEYVKGYSSTYGVEMDARLVEINENKP